MDADKLIVDLRPTDRGNLKAFADVSFPFEGGEVTVRGFRIIHQDGRAPWVAYPQTSYMNKAGEFINRNLLEISRRLKRSIDEKLLSEFDLSRDRT